MPENKSPLEQALDLFVYAPLGLALTAREELPKLVEKGRTQVSGQVGMARMIGQFAVTQGQREAEKQVRKATERFNRPPADAGASASPARPEPSKPEPDMTPLAPSPAAQAAPSATNGGGVPPVDQLAIPGYDSLSAGQVVPRLAGLSGDELEAVARYEAATRHRKTILSRVSQLQNAG
ncbi:MAG: hypothetical protein QOK43_1439 [Acidimicrobiaceae bacterium]|nr:hypothetical protein [Acidimicrobiaceae bacterium]